MHADRAAAAAYGGPKWSPRVAASRVELGSIWAACGIDSEWAPLRAVLLHRPGAELSAIDDADALQMLAPPVPECATAQHDRIATIYREHGVTVHYVEPQRPAPNLMFAADLLFMTPLGAIVARPASTVRAGEEREVARRLAELGIPILRTVAGTGVFEGADAMWLDAETVLLGTGLRTNAEGAAQVTTTLAEQGARVICVDVPRTAMHLMAMLRIIDRDLAFVRDILDPSVIEVLRARGIAVHPFPDRAELERGHAGNVVTLAPRRILMPADNPRTAAAYRACGVECVMVDVSELSKAAGAIGCLTAVLQRDVLA